MLKLTLMSDTIANSISSSYASPIRVAPPVLSYEYEYIYE